MLKKQLLISFLILWSQNSSCLLIGTLWELAQYGWKFAKVLEAMETEKKPGQDPISILEGSANHQEIIDKLDKINNKLEDLQSYTKNKLSDIEALIRRLPNEMELRIMKTKIEEFILTTHNKWTLFGAYMRDKENTTDEALKQLADRIRSSIGEKLHIFRNTITPLVSIDKSTRGFFMLLAEHTLEQNDILCDTGETVHHILTRLFETVIETEIKAYILQFFAHRILLHKNKGWRLECGLLKQQFRVQFGNNSEIYRMSLNSTVLPYIRSCDPEVWQRNENFYELEGLIQQTIYRRPDCWKKGVWNCARLAAGEAFPRCSIYPMNDHATCDSNKLYNCKDIRKARDIVEVCPWESGPYRMRYVKINGDAHGTDIKSSCPSDYYQKFDGTRAFGIDDRVCSCQCHSQKWQILLATQWSDVRHHFVIVGSRFAKDGNTIYIQIAQGRLEKNGRISNFSWVQPEKSPYSLRGITLENAVFYLEDLQLPLGYTVTGISLMEIRGGFGISIYGREMDYYKLAQEEINSQNTHWIGRTTPWRVERSDISHDFGQSTIPLFDAVPVETKPLSPIGGVGLFLKVQNGYAGFLSLRLFPINYTYHMDTFMQKHNLSLLSIWDN